MNGPLAPGALVQHYRVDRLLGEGAMGAVYRAYDTEHGDRLVALKVMSAEAARQPSARRRFLREARAAKAVDHPNVVRVIDVFEGDGQPVMAMEYLKGKSFEDHIDALGGRVPLCELARIMVRVASAVGTAHALGIVHRDLKPLNIFITEGDRLDVKVLDFGIAKLTSLHGAAAQTEALTQTGAIMGTPFYMAPEQAMGERDVDHRADIWSLGIILYRCVTGIIPTEGTSFGDVFKKVVLAEFGRIEELAPDTPPELASLVHRMLSRAREERPWDLREVHETLVQLAEEPSPTFSTAILAEPSTDPDDEAPTRISAIERHSPAPAARAPLALAPAGLVRPADRPSAPNEAVAPSATADGGGTIVTPVQRFPWRTIAIVVAVVAALVAALRWA